MDTGIISIHGKDYQTVALRVKKLREEHPDWAITTEVLSGADIILMKAFVSDNNGNVIGTGHAEEVRGSTNINKTSALENCETSAIGRALAACGYGGTEYASANEMKAVVEYITEEQNKEIQKLVKDTNSDVDKFLSFLGAETFEAIPASKYKTAITMLNKKKNSNDNS